MTDIQQLYDTAKPLISYPTVVEKIHAMAEEINQFYAPVRAQKARQPLVILTVMNGGLVFAGHLLPHLEMPLEQDYCQTQRYGMNTKGGRLSWLVKPQLNFSGRDILILDDIFDEGKTLSAIYRQCLEAGAARVRSAVLAYKSLAARPEDCIAPDFQGLTVPDVYVFGMGMDCQGYWRNAPGIFELRDEQ